MIVVGLSGYAGAGKDAVADILVRDHGFTKMSFAAPVKRLVRNLDPIVGYSVYVCDCGNLSDCPIEADEIKISDLYDGYGYDDETIKDSPYGEEVRRLWQRFGTEVMRNEDPNFWVDLALKDLFESDAERVVFTDVRFPNEAEAIHNLSVPIFTGTGGDLYFSPFQPSLWQISRVGDEILYPAGHESESHVGLMDEEIQLLNAGTLEDLEEPVAIAMDMLLERDYPAQMALEIEGWE